MNPVIHIARKEFFEAIRDSRVRKSVLLSPFITSIVVLVLIGGVVAMISKPENQKLSYVGKENQLTKGLKDKKVSVNAITDRAQAESEVRDGKSRLVLVFPDDFDAQLTAGKPVQVEAIYNPDEDSSQLSLAVVNQTFDEVNKAALGNYLASKGTKEDEIEPLHLKETKVVVAKKAAGSFMIQIVPYMLIIWAYFSGMGTASDMVAGEKDKNTLETLLISPVSRGDIVFGKLLALTGISLLSSLSSLLGMAVGSQIHLGNANGALQSSLSLSGPAMLTILAVQIPLVVFFASVLIAVSTLARNPREAQQRMGAMSALVTMPAAFSQFIGFTDLANNPMVALIPILNAASTIRKVLLGKFPALEIALTIGVSLALAGIALFYASRLFKDEKVLLRI